MPAGRARRERVGRHLHHPSPLTERPYQRAQSSPIRVEPRRQRLWATQARRPCRVPRAHRGERREMSPPLAILRRRVGNRRIEREHPHQPFQDVRRNRVGLRIVVDVDVESVHHVETRIREQFLQRLALDRFVDLRLQERREIRIDRQRFHRRQRGCNLGRGSCRCARRRGDRNARARRSGRCQRRSGVGSLRSAGRIELATRPAPQRKPVARRSIGRHRHRKSRGQP